MNNTIISLIFFTLSLLSSCAKPINDFLDAPGKPEVHQSHPDFYPYIGEFNFIFDVDARTPIIYGVEEEKFAGVCYMWNTGYREIKINKTHWETYSESQREILIFHELSHCEFNLGHDDSVRPINYCPQSVMRSYLFSKYEAAYCYDPRRDDYIDDLKIKRTEK